MQEETRVTVTQDFFYVAAYAGFNVLVFYFGEDGSDQVLFHPVIAWQIMGDDVNPVTVEGTDEMSAILYPTGRVMGPYGSGKHWPNLGAWQQEARREALTFPDDEETG